MKNSRVVRIPTVVLDPTQQQLDLGEREHVLRCIGIAEIYDRVRSSGQPGGRSGEGGDGARGLEMKPRFNGWDGATYRGPA